MADTLNDKQRRRYARNLPLIGESGQRKLLASRLLVIGAGALGSASIAYLAAAGVGHIGIVDDDRVELSNLQRQVLYENGDIGRLKTESARDRVEELNPDVIVHIHTERLSAENASRLIVDYDIVADGCDNFKTRFAVNEACHRAGKTLVSAAVRAWEGQLAVFKSAPGNGEPCYRCFVGTSPDDERGCNDAGVIGALTGALGSLQALEVIKELLTVGESLAGRLMLIDALFLNTRIIRIAHDPHCPCCGAA